MLPLPLTALWSYRRAIGIGVGALALVVGLAIYRSHLIGVGEGRERLKWEAKVSEARQAKIDEYETKLTAYKADLAKSQAATAALSVTLTAYQTANEALLQAVSKAKLTVTYANPANPACPADRLGSDYRLLYNAAVTGSAASPAPAGPAR